MSTRIGACASSLASLSSEVFLLYEQCNVHRKASMLKAHAHCFYRQEGSRSEGILQWLTAITESSRCVHTLHSASVC